jgi:hypothetical protein
VNRILVRVATAIVGAFALLYLVVWLELKGLR